MERLLAAPDENRVQAAVGKAHPVLRLESEVYNTIHQAFFTIESDTNVKSRPARPARETNANLIRALRADHERFNSFVQDELRATHETLFLHFETVEIPAAVGQVLDEVVRTASSLEEVRAVLEVLASRVGDDARRLDAHLSRLVEGVEAKRQRFSNELEKLIREDYWRGSRQRRAAGETHVAHQQASLRMAFHRSLHKVTREFQRQLAAKADLLAQTIEALRGYQAKIKELNRGLKQVISSDSTLVVAPAEAKGIVQKITADYKRADRPGGRAAGLESPHRGGAR